MRFRGSGVVLTTEQVARVLGVSRQYVRRIPGMQAVSGYPAEQVIARLIHLGRPRAEAEAAVTAALRED
jgi:transcriptional regulator with XRE-family HTH domain